MMTTLMSSDERTTGLMGVPLIQRGVEVDVGPWPNRCVPLQGACGIGEEDADWFFGRERSTATLLVQLCGALDVGGIIMLVGASGAGKSSLINAGLVPALARGALTTGSGNWPVVIMTPGIDPLDELARHVPELTETLDIAQYATRVKGNVTFPSSPMNLPADRKKTDN